MLELYRRIKHRREKLNMTQDALAKKAGYKSRTSIHKIELGLTDLSQSKIIDLFGNIKICYNSIGDKNENDRTSG